MKHTSPFARLLLGAVLLGSPLAASAQTTIAQARAAGVGANVNFRGIVTNGPELGVIRYIQDGTAGIAVYSPQLSATVAGDSVIVAGGNVNYNGLLEVTNVTNLQVLAQGRTVTPVTVSAAQAATVYAEQYEGMLVRIDGNTAITTTGGAAVSTFAGNTNYQINGNGTLLVRTNSASTGPTGIVGRPAPTGGFDLIGVMSQFSPTGTGGYQLLPRLYADFVLGNAPNILTLPRPSNITQTSLTLTFTTQNAGDGRIDYGTSPLTMSQNVVSSTVGTQHDVTLTGLLPATVYYVRATSTNANGNSVSAIVPVITESQSTGHVRLWFNRPVDNSYAWPTTNLAQQFIQTIDDSIVALIGRAQQTLDIEIYNWNNLDIVNAVNAAKLRGVQVRVVIDATASGNSTQGLMPTIPMVQRNTTQGIMHNKVLIIDADATNPSQPQVWCGATNWTSGQMNTDPNSALVIQDQSLARVYKMEFDEMWGSSTAVPGAPKFGPQKADNTPHYLRIGGHDVESWFSPSDNVNAKLIETIGTAQNDLHFATMVLTRSDIAQAIRNQIQANNITQCSEGIVNDTSGATGPFMTIKNVLTTRMQKYAGGGIFHHKYLLVDVGGSDPTTWTGSHNWSNNANNNNDENTLVFHDAQVTNQYYQEFAKRIADQSAGIALCQLRTTGLTDDRAGSTRLSAQVYPNPTAGSFRVVSASDLRGPVQVELLDANGRRVLTTTTTATDDRTIGLDADQLPTGLYHLRVTSAAGTQFGRVSVVR